MYADPAGIFLTENPIFQKKNAVLADFAAGLSKIIKQNLSGGCLEGGPVPLRLLLRSRRLSCNISKASFDGDVLVLIDICKVVIVLCIRRNSYKA